MWAEYFLVMLGVQQLFSKQDKNFLHLVPLILATKTFYCVLIFSVTFSLVL